MGWTRLCPEPSQCAFFEVHIYETHRYFPVFLQTDILSTNTLVDVGKHVNILRSKAQLEKILGRPLQKNELEFVKLDNIQVKTFDGIIIENISRIYGYVHKLFLRTKILLSAHFMVMKTRGQMHKQIKKNNCLHLLERVYFPKVLL